MADLIEREAVMKALQAIHTHDGMELSADVDYVEACSAIYNIRAVDAEPVRHGWWIHCKGKSNLWYCSECGEKIIYNPTRKTYTPQKLPVHEINKYCRCCGARMGMEEKQ